MLSRCEIRSWSEFGGDRCQVFLVQRLEKLAPNLLYERLIIRSRTNVDIDDPALFSQDIDRVIRLKQNITDEELILD